jgi:hypothetical protein
MWPIAPCPTRRKAVFLCLLEERCSMEPLDTDLRYTTSEPQPAPAGSRYNVMFILPIIGIIFVLIFISAAIFQFDLSDLVDSLVGLMLLLFVAMIALLFWAFAPRPNA